MNVDPLFFWEAVEANIILIGVLIVGWGRMVNQRNPPIPTQRPSTEGRPSSLSALRASPSPGRPANSDLFSSSAQYRTLDGEQDYVFNFRQMPDATFRVYIVGQPPYDGRATDPHSTHRHQDSDGFFICWSEPITTYEDAKEIARCFAEATEKYRKFGTRF